MFARLLMFSVVCLAGGCNLCTQAILTNYSPPDNRAAPVRQRLIDGDPCAASKVALIDVDGMLLNRNFKGQESMGENPVALFREKLEAAAADPCIAAVVVRINSPGGAVTASDIMRRDLARFRDMTGKPVVASILDVGAGGAYYLATAADTITAHPTSVVGGVGVILNVYNLEEAMSQYNILARPVRAGENIDIGSPIRPLSDEAAEILSEITEQLHERFMAAVLATRAIPEPARPLVFDGRIFLAGQAQEFALVDEIAYLDEAIALAANLGGAPPNARVVMFRRANDRALTQYDITPNTPGYFASVPVDLPGADRASLPSFLYLWQPEPGLETGNY